MKNQKTEIIEGFEVYGNKGGNYIKVGRFSEEDNRMFLEVGHCCVVTFRGIVTAELLSSFLSQVKNNKGLMDQMKESLEWEEGYNEKVCRPCKELSYFESPILKR